MLSFEGLVAGNWEKYRDLVLQSENVFPENIRSSPEDFDHMLSGNDCLAMVAIADSKYIGNIIGCDVPPEDRAYYEIAGMPGNARIIYILNIVINPEHQGKGYGKQLMREFIKAAKANGFDYIAGHFRQNGSLKLIKAFGAKEEGVCRNWENIGEDCVTCCLDIHKISAQELIGPATPANGLLPMARGEEAKPDMSPSPSAVAPGMHDLQHADTDPLAHDASFPDPVQHF